ncbi:fimbrial assembly chaperone [Pseudomonas fluorescens HK44]|uniref:Fimbrial assembly chaperone n=1 Tax=Pseudomonas fluorescens HK44 TaxID=1042209 RepID=A0A010S4P6_PSEFL|nr:molecular chaperone [Pseudomonas fluorescens]EXF95614.1 fimbrial assembly chaperone [Pseudomonas fluorescens HK44]
MKTWQALIFTASTLWMTLQTAQAGVVIGATRVVYDGAQRESSLTVNNPDKTTPYLIQSWIQNSSETDTSKAPFLITPPLFRLDASQENVLRIVRTGASLPENQESVFWLNVIAIPASEKSDKNLLQITVKTQIKLFYRPAGLSGRLATESYKALEFKRVGNQLQAHNPTPFYVSFYTLKYGEQAIDDAKMIAPNSTQRWTLPDVISAGSVSWQAITDYGGISPVARSSL